MTTPGEFIKLVNDSVPNAKKVFTEGNCFKLYKLMKAMFPESEAWYDGVVGHVYTYLNGHFYDINGVVLLQNLEELDLEAMTGAQMEGAEHWRYKPTNGS